MDRAGPPPDSLNTHRLTTDRLMIDLPERADAGHLYELVGRADRRAVCATLLWDGPDDVADVSAWIGRCRTETFGNSGYHWVIRDRTGALTGSPGRAIGSIGTRPRPAPGRADVGYWLGKPYWGKGLMGEALREVVRLGFEELAYAKVEAEVFTTNPRGVRLVERVGMRQEGMVRRAYRKYGEWVDLALFGMLSEEWQTV